MAAGELAVHAGAVEGEVMRALYTFLVVEFACIVAVLLAVHVGAQA
jgi:hypothetical protein